MTKQKEESESNSEMTDTQREKDIQGGYTSSLPALAAHTFVFLSLFSLHFVKMTVIQEDLWAFRLLHHLGAPQIFIDFSQKGVTSLLAKSAASGNFVIQLK